MAPKKIEFTVLFAVFAVIILTSGCDNVNGERTVYGIEPEEETIVVEQICNDLLLPEESVRLKTDIISKRDSGLVTHTFSTEQKCIAVDNFFRQSLSSRGWKLERATRGGLIFPEITLEASSGDWNIYLGCEDMRDFRGVRRFKVSCQWERKRR